MPMKRELAGAASYLLTSRSFPKARKIYSGLLRKANWVCLLRRLGAL
jgi:hypothetical protein